MRKHSRKNRSTIRASHSSIPMFLIAVAILAVGAVTVVSRQSLSTKQPAKTAIQHWTGTATQDSALLPEPHLQGNPDVLADGLKEMIDQSTEGLAEVHHRDGSVSVNLEARFQSVTVAKDVNGRLSQSCVDNPQAAGAFFNIDPKLIDKKPRALVAPATKE